MTQITRRLRKFTRDPEHIIRNKGKRITDISLAILGTIERYRIVPTSLLLHLVNRNQRVAYRHLQHLYHSRLVNRFCFFGPTGRPSEFNYFLDNPEALHLLIDGGIGDPETIDFEQLKRNREKWTPILDRQSLDFATGDPGSPEQDQAPGKPSEGQRLFLKHELMISRFHGMLELATGASEGRVKLLSWHQGPVLHSSIEAPKMSYINGEWRKQEGDERIPHRPDALFSIHTEGQEEPRHFFYEADRKTTTTTRIIKKLRGHFHYIAKARRHHDDYGIQRIRAVLTETLDTKWAEALRIAAQHPVVSGPKPSELFWFTSAEFFTKQIQKPIGRNPKAIHRVPYYLENPDVVFRPLWFSPIDAVGARPRSLMDNN